MDQRFCADSNGDGSVNIADALTILNFLFSSESTPYCIAQGQSLPFATRDETEALRTELQELREQLQRRPRYYSGKYTGDGTLERTIATGITGGTIKALWLTSLEAEGHYWMDSWFSTEMVLPAYNGNPGQGRVSLSGADFVLEGTPDDYCNRADREYVWHALVIDDKG
jgi:hypothetical protein